MLVLLVFVPERHGIVIGSRHLLNSLVKGQYSGMVWSPLLCFQADAAIIKNLYVKCAE